MESIIVQVIAGIVTLAGVIITCASNHRKTLTEFKLQQEVFNVKLKEQMDAHNELFNSKIQDLTSEVREHNNFARRMPVVESQMADMVRRIEQLEKKVQ